MKFCPNCGADISIEQTLCEQCSQPETVSKTINIKLCPSYRIFYKGQWSKFFDLNQAVDQIIKSAISKKAKLIDEIDLEILEKPGLNVQNEVKYKLNKDTYKITLNIDITYSPQVAKIGSGYFEGVLQLRQAGPEVQKFVKNHLLKNSEINIAKIQGSDENPDIYFGSKKALKNLSSKLINHFGGWIETNAKLFSQDRQTGKNIYRINTLVKIAKFTHKDVIKLNDLLYYVTEISDKLNLIDLKNNKKETKKVTREISEIIPEKKYPAVITQIEPVIEALHPTTYQPITIQNPFKKELSIGQKVKIVIDEQAYIIKT